MSATPLISVVVPVFNEEATVISVIERLRTIPLPGRREIVVVNDGSRDRTREALDGVTGRYPDVIVIHVPQNRGKGHALRVGFARTTGTVVGAKDRALSHVHNIFFCLDLDVDGARNTVEEFEFKPLLPAREKATTRWKPIAKETTRELEPTSFRSWRVVNHKSKNKLGQPRSYELVPGGNGIFRGMHYARRKMADGEPFAHADLWVTRYHSREVPPANPLKESLPGMLTDEAVDNEDVVLWYMMSMHHQPRSEDWPAMPVDWHGFRLVPRDFLDGSPVEIKR